MIRNPDFFLRSVADSLVVVPVGGATSVFPGMITLNPTGGYLWELLAEEQTMASLADALVTRYEVDREQAMDDATAFVQKLLSVGAVIDR